MDIKTLTVNGYTAQVTKNTYMFSESFLHSIGCVLDDKRLKFLKAKPFLAFLIHIMPKEIDVLKTKKHAICSAYMQDNETAILDLWETPDFIDILCTESINCFKTALKQTCEELHIEVCEAHSKNPKLMKLVGFNYTGNKDEDDYRIFRRRMVVK